MSAEECSNTCQHWATQRDSQLTCSQYLEPGTCSDPEDNSTSSTSSTNTSSSSTTSFTVPRWGFDPQRRRCVPFYYAGCGGNQNNFPSLEECEALCPSTTSPVITFTGGPGPQFLRRNEESRIGVRIRANPEPTVQWRHNGRNITQYDYQVGQVQHLLCFTAAIFQFLVSEDHSLLIKNPSDFDAGKYELLADNGIGAPASVETEVIVYPIFPKISLLAEKRSFSPDSEAQISCKITGCRTLDLNFPSD